MKQFIKTFKRADIEFLQSEMRRSAEYKDQMLTLYTPQQVEEIRTYKYISLVERLCNFIEKNEEKIKFWCKIISVAAIISALVFAGYKIVSVFSYDNSIRESDYYERILEK